MSSVLIPEGAREPSTDRPRDAAETLWGDPGRRRWRALTDPTSILPVLAGVGLTLLGFVLMAIAWAAVAGETDVWRQFPYLLSAGLPGLGLVMVGLVLVNVSIRRQDGARRAQQMAALTEALRDLQRSPE